MKQVLITGATGAIGSALAPLLLEEQDCQVHLLLRGDNEDHLQNRLAQLLSFWNLEPDDDKRSRLHAYRGDVCLPHLGLADHTYQRLTDQLSHVIHCAGNVKLNQPLDAARASAVDSVKHVIALAKACQSRGAFSKLDVVSTVGVAGRTSGLVPEQPLAARTFHNTYEAAKAEAEQVLWGEMQAGLPATIHRPSMVVGDSGSGRIIHFQVFYYLAEFLAGRRTRGLMPRMANARLDIIPVDYVARAILLAHGDAETTGDVFHLCSGPDLSPRLSELSIQLQRFFTDFGYDVPRLRQIPRAAFSNATWLAGLLTLGKTRRTLRSAPYFLSYLADEQLFDNARTAEYLTSHGLATPVVAKYLERVISFYLNEKRGELNEKRGETNATSRPMAKVESATKAVQSTGIHASQQGGERFSCEETSIPQ